MAQTISVSGPGSDSGPIQVTSTATSLTVNWPDEKDRMWQAVFSLDSRRPLISEISTGGKAVIEAARPFYRLETGKRRGGWDAFFDFPPTAPEGTRTFLGEFHPHKATVSRDGERVTVTFDGMRSGIFEGSLHMSFSPEADSSSSRQRCRRRSLTRLISTTPACVSERDPI